MRAWFVALFIAFGVAGAARAGEAFATDWAPAPEAAARLVAGGPNDAALEIRLAPGAITYWRDPGEAGAPPTFDFSASINVARAEALFPAPTRIVEPDGSEAFGYRDEAAFPIAVERRDATKPATLALSLTYAVCAKLCLPAKANLTLTLPAAGATPYAATIAAARAATPRRVDLSALGAELTALDARDWRLCLPAEPGPPRDLFIEAPEGWFFTTKAAPGAAGRDCFAIALEDQPAGGAPPIPVRATIVGGDGAVETALTLGARD